MAEQHPVVKTIGLTKVFKDFWRRNKVVAVEDLDLEIRHGEVFGLLGPNGSGKSTTIKMLLGLLHPTRGRISIFGRPPTDVATKARIGFLPEESYLYRFLDGRETLHLYGKLFDQGRRTRGVRVDKLLQMVGLQHQSRRRIGEYSKGMARRIGLAQALINDPDFLILDEPTTGMDPIGTRQIKDLIRELAHRGKTILLSSHLLSDVQDVCDRVCILYGGQVRAEGQVHTLLSQEQKTQITAPRLDDQQIERVRQVLSADGHEQDIEVSHPTERLENLFVRIVEQAQADQVRTSGVGASAGMADFLGDPGDDRVIDALVAAGSEVDGGSVRPAVVERPAAGPAQEVIGELLDRDDRPQGGASTEEAAARDTGPGAEQPDREVIDGLLGQPAPPPKGQHGPEERGGG